MCLTSKSSGSRRTAYLFLCFFFGRFRQVMQSIFAAIPLPPLGVWLRLIIRRLDVNEMGSIDNPETAKFRRHFERLNLN